MTALPVDVDCERLNCMRGEPRDEPEAESTAETHCSWSRLFIIHVSMKATQVLSQF